MKKLFLFTLLGFISLGLVASGGGGASADVVELVTIKERLWLAAQGGRIDEIRELLTDLPERFNINKSFGKVNLLMVAAANDHVNVVRFLLDIDIEVNARISWTALMYAAKYGSVDSARLLLLAGAFVDIQDDHGYTALMIAAEEGHLEIVEMLLQAGADVSNHDFSGSTAINRAIRCGHSEVVRALLLSIGYAQHQNRKNDAFIYSVWFGNIDLVNVFLRIGGVLEARTLKGDTALMIAIEMGYVEVVEALLAAGVSVNATNNKGKTALDIAIKRDRSDIVIVLQGARAVRGNNQGGLADADQ